jgi:heat shock protein HslJ
MNRLLIALGVHLLLLGCAATAPKPDPRSLDSLPGTHWVAPEFADPAQPGGRQVGLQFGAKGQVSGFAGCNGFNGRATVDGNKLRLGPLGSTMMACDAAASKRERGFHAKLDATRRARLEAGRLELLNEDGELLLRLEPAR